MQKNFILPSTPKIKYVQQGEDKRKFCVIPIRAINDKRLTRRDLINLMLLASYSSPNGYSFVALSTMAKYRGVSSPAISKGLKRLEGFGYIKNVRKGYTNLRGALRRIIFDESITDIDAISISNTNEVVDYHERENMKRSNRKQSTINQQAGNDSALSFDEAVLVVSHSLKSDADILKLERLVSQGITLAELRAAFEV